MRRKPLTVGALDDQETVAAKIAKYNLLAVPVLEADGQVVGFVTVDDVIDVMIEEGTEDVLKMGAVEAGALDEPYIATPFWGLIRKRAGWLLVLFLSEMLTATAMGRFEDEIARAVVLALFVPLIISSGGNSGSQAASLIIRALAVGELRLKDWWRVMRREVLAGLVLGNTLGLVGFLRITLWSLVLSGLWPALAPRRGHHLAVPPRRCALGHPLGLHAPDRAEAPRDGPRGVVRALRGHAGRRDRDRHLLRGRGAGPAGYPSVTARLKPWASVPGRPLRALLVLLTAVACKAPGGSSGPEAAVPSAASPPARVIRVDQSSVVIEGRWQPVDASGASDDVTYVVRATCVRSERRCREELTTVQAGHSPATETREYKVREWTDWKLVAARAEGPEEVAAAGFAHRTRSGEGHRQPQGSNQPETRWRLE